MQLYLNVRNEPIPSPFAPVLRRAIENLDLSEKKFAALVGVSAPTISYWVTGQTLPTENNLEKILAVVSTRDARRLQRAWRSADLARKRWKAEVLLDP